MISSMLMSVSLTRSSHAESVPFTLSAAKNETRRSEGRARVKIGVKVRVRVKDSGSDYVGVQDKDCVRQEWVRVGP